MNVDIVYLVTGLPSLLSKILKLKTRKLVTLQITDNANQIRNVQSVRDVEPGETARHPAADGAFYFHKTKETILTNNLQKPLKNTLATNIQFRKILFLVFSEPV